MATSSILGGDRVPRRPGGTDVASLGPSDSTDSGSDTRGGFDDDELASDTDAEGTASACGQGMGTGDACEPVTSERHLPSEFAIGSSE